MFIVCVVNDSPPTEIYTYWPTLSLHDSRPISYEPLLSAHSYHRYFDGPVQFGKPFNAVFFNRRDLAQPIPDHDPQIYEMASSYIDTRFPATSLNLVPRVYAIATRLQIGRAHV